MIPSIPIVPITLSICWPITSPAWNSPMFALMVSRRTLAEFVSLHQQLPTLQTNSTLCSTSGIVPQFLHVHLHSWLSSFSSTSSDLHFGHSIHWSDIFSLILVTTPVILTKSPTWLVFVFGVKKVRSGFGVMTTSVNEEYPSTDRLPYLSIFKPWITVWKDILYGSSMNFFVGKGFLTFTFW